MDAPKFSIVFNKLSMEKFDLCFPLCHFSCFETTTTTALQLRLFIACAVCVCVFSSKLNLHHWFAYEWMKMSTKSFKTSRNCFQNTFMGLVVCGLSHNCLCLCASVWLVLVFRARVLHTFYVFFSHFTQLFLS